MIDLEKIVGCKKSEKNEAENDGDLTKKKEMKQN